MACLLMLLPVGRLARMQAHRDGGRRGKVRPTGFPAPQQTSDENENSNAQGPQAPLLKEACTGRFSVCTNATCGKLFNLRKKVAVDTAKKDAQGHTTHQCHMSSATLEEGYLPCCNNMTACTQSTSWWPHSALSRPTGSGTLHPGRASRTGRMMSLHGASWAGESGFAGMCDDRACSG